MQGSMKLHQMPFRCEPEYMEQLETLAGYYGTKNKTKLLKKLISDAYKAQIINPQLNKKEG